MIIRELRAKNDLHCGRVQQQNTAQSTGEKVVVNRRSVIVDAARTGSEDLLDVGHSVAESHLVEDKVEQQSVVCVAVCNEINHAVDLSRAAWLMLAHSKLVVGLDGILQSDASRLSQMRFRRAQLRHRRAVRGVVRDRLRRACSSGLVGPGGHHVVLL